MGPKSKKHILIRDRETEGGDVKVKTEIEVMPPQVMEGQDLPGITRSKESGVGWFISQKLQKGTNFANILVADFWSPEL